MADRKNPDYPFIRRIDGADKVAPRPRGRQWYLDPDLQRRYAGSAKVERTEAPSLPREGELKGRFVKHRMPRAPRTVPVLDLAPMVAPEVPDVQRGPRQVARDRYVRLQVLVEGDALTVVDSALVDGPLREGASFPGRFAYDVTIGDELLHAGPAPDLGVRRSFINPDGPEDERRHVVTELPTFVFTARVPAEAVTRAALPDIRIRLFRLKDEAVAERVRLEPVDRRFPREARVLAEGTGLPAAALPASIARRGEITGQGAGRQG